MKTISKKIKWALLLFLVALPLPIMADNCSGLFDCFGNMRAAAAAAAAIALFGALVSMGLDFIPGVGTAKGVIEAVTGRDLITGQELSAFERALGVLPFVGGLAGAASAARAVDRASDAMRAVDHATDAVRAADRTGDAVRAADKMSDASRAANRADDAADAASAVSRERVPNKNCTRVGEPVDVASGRLISEAIDIELPGPIPFLWQRVYYSDSAYNGPCGFGWHHSFDAAVWEEEPLNAVVLRWTDGREIFFKKPAAGEKSFNRKERMELWAAEKGYTVWSIEERLYYQFHTLPGQAVYSLWEIKNTNGHIIKPEYNGNNQLEKITDSAGRSIIITYNGQGRIAVVLLPAPEKKNPPFAAITYSYDNATGDLTGVADALNAVNKYEYSNHLLVKRILRNGFNFYFEYDGPGTGARCIKTWGDGNYMAYTLTYEDGKTTVINSLGNITVYIHQNGLVTSETNSLGAVKKYEYNEHLELLAETDALGHSARYEYDERGNRVSVVYPDGAATKTEFSGDLAVKGTDLMNFEWQWMYDENGNLAERVSPGGDRVKFQYVNGMLSAVLHPSGDIFHYAYDEEFNLNQVTAPGNTSQRWLYDYLGRCTKYTDACGASEWFAYDLKNRVTRINEPDGNERRFEYDSMDNLLTSKDRETETGFDYAGINSLSARLEAGAAVKFEYDTEGNLTAITNQNGSTYRYRLDAEGQVMEETGFDGKTHTYKRDLCGNIIETRRPGGSILEYEYDAMSRLTKIHYPGGETFSYSYDGSGQITAAVNSMAQVQFEYDKLGRKNKETCNGVSINSVYDAQGNRLELGSTLGYRILRNYNAMGNMVQAQCGAWQCQVEYDAMGREVKRLMPGGLVNEWKRDAAGRPLFQQIVCPGREKRTRNYQWQTNNRLEQVADNYSGLSKFEYDKRGNLTGAVHDNGSRQYRVADAVNNFYKQPVADAGKYSNGAQLLESAAFNYTYDELGNLTQKLGPDGEKWQYRWYGFGMLKEVETPSGETIQFEYDALHRRTAKRAGNKTTKWIWDGDVPLHEITENRFDGTNVNELITWIFDENSHVPAARLKNENVQCIITGHLGTPLEMYGNNGVRAWAAETGIFGDSRILEGSFTDCPFRFQGQYADEETGLYYNRFRYYNPESGNYISADPIGLAGNTPTVYSYVKNPNSQVDPMGLQIPLNEGGYSVYALVDKITGKPFYVGISNDDARRLTEHIESGRFNPKTDKIQVLERDLKYKQARGFEQAYIEHYKTRTGVIGEDISSTNRGNKINSFEKTRTDARGRAFNTEYETARTRIKAGCP